MKSELLKTYWAENFTPLYTYTASEIKGKVNDKSFHFLTECGLPDNAAPFLSFELVRENKLCTPAQILKFEFDGLDEFLMFGSNGSGDPVCIDRVENNEIVYLNHDNYFERIYMNRSIEQFAMCLILYKEFLKSIALVESTVLSRRKFNEDEFQKLKSDFLAADQTCLQENSFWLDEVNYLLHERDND
jgi:hypothetical protein